MARVQGQSDGGLAGDVVGHRVGDQADDALDARALQLPDGGRGFCHGGGDEDVVALVAGLLAGWKLIIPEGRFDPEQVLGLIQD